MVVLLQLTDIIWYVGKENTIPGEGVTLRAKSWTLLKKVGGW
jgi:hypothetical protein